MTLGAVAWAWPEAEPQAREASLAEPSVERAPAASGAPLAGSEDPGEDSPGAVPLQEFVDSTGAGSAEGPEAVTSDAEPKPVEPEATVPTPSELPPAPSPKSRPSKPAGVSNRKPPKSTATTQLFLDVYTSRDGTVTVSVDGRQLLHSHVDALKQMNAGFRGFGKKRYRAEVHVPSRASEIRIGFEPKKSGATLEASVTWELPPGGQALAAVEIGMRARELEVELLERTEAEGP